jgi:putative transposase
MAHAYTSIHFHCVFSTLGRRRLLNPELLGKTCRYITGIVTNIRGKMLRINGTEDHLHILLGLPADVHVAEAMMKIKSNSSKWIHQTLPNMRHFAWQEGYGAFSVSFSNLDRVRQYLARQDEIHEKTGFKEEFLALLSRHRIDFDERFLWE